MRIGIFGSKNDPQCQAVAKAAGQMGVGSVIIDYEALDQGVPLSFVDDSVFFQDECLDDIRGYYLRFIPTPYVTALKKNDQLVLYEDWYTFFMQSRERAAVYVSWLLNLRHRGVVLVNGPHAGSVIQYKPLELEVLRSMGARIPRTLISNDPARIRQFHAEVKDVIYKPVLGGALAQVLDKQALKHLDLVKASPVIFQERVQGDDLRVTLVGDRIVSAVSIEPPERTMDYRSSPGYTAGGTHYREVSIPPAIEDFCKRAARECGLVFTGIDIKRSGEDYVFLELNSSPVYYEVEMKTGHPITQELTRYVVEQARKSTR